MKINENTELKFDLKTIISLIVLTTTFVGMYYTLQSDIEDAKEMPPAVIDRIEYDLKQEFFTEHINDLEDEVDKGIGCILFKNEDYYVVTILYPNR